VDLNFEKIASRKFSYEVIHLGEIDSTNSYAKNAIIGGKAPPFVAMARTQTNSYGQRGARWDGSVIGNLYFSIAFAVSKTAKARLTILSQFTAIKICEALWSEFSILAKTKWPNDIFICGRKVGGLLLEVVGNSSYAVLGIGINVKEAPKNVESVYGLSCLQDFCLKNLDFAAVAIATIDSAISAVNSYEMCTIGEFCRRWTRFDVFNGMAVAVGWPSGGVSNGTVIGIDRGIGRGGELIIETAEGRFVKITQGDAQILPMPMP
jgi:BirA family biotin operon repressor/biotin-[acetyl-CoA-carboxylase] ligase